MSVSLYTTYYQRILNTPGGDEIQQKTIDLFSAPRQLPIDEAFYKLTLKLLKYSNHEFKDAIKNCLANSDIESQISVQFQGLLNIPSFIAINLYLFKAEQSRLLTNFIVRSNANSEIQAVYNALCSIEEGSLFKVIAKTSNNSTLMEFAHNL